MQKSYRWVLFFNTLVLIFTAAPVWANPSALLFDFLQPSADAHVTGNNNQFAITMSSNQTVRKLVVSAYSTAPGGVCSGTQRALVPMDAGVDVTLSSGVTYVATDASSWGLVSNNGGASTWVQPNTRCLIYDFQDSNGTSLHQKTCARWYSRASPTGSACAGSTDCGQNSACTDSW